MPLTSSVGYNIQELKKANARRKKKRPMRQVKAIALDAARKQGKPTMTKTATGPARRIRPTKPLATPSARRITESVKPIRPARPARRPKRMMARAGLTRKY